MGWVVCSGLSVGTLFTLFVVPAMYVFLAEDHHAQGAALASGEGSAAQGTIT